MSYIDHSESSNGVMKKFKVVLLGDQAVGKSSIISRYVSDNFSISIESTVGVDF